MKARKSGRASDHSGSTFDSFLEQEGIRDQVEAIALKRVWAWKLDQSALNKARRANKPGLVQVTETRRRK